MRRKPRGDASPDRHMETRGSSASLSRLAASLFRPRTALVSLRHSSAAAVCLCAITDTGVEGIGREREREKTVLATPLFLRLLSLRFSISLHSHSLLHSSFKRLWVLNAPSSARRLTSVAAREGEPK